MRDYSPRLRVRSILRPYYTDFEGSAVSPDVDTEGFTEHDVVIDGSVTVEGSEVRIRGVTITGDLSAKGNDFGISFSVVKGATSITGNGGAFVRNVFCGTTTVPSSNATLLDNYGVEPLITLPAVACD